MIIYIEKERAIEILKKRLNEMIAFANGTDTTAWQSRILSDLEEIFGPMSKQHIEIVSLRFTTVYSSAAQSVFSKAQSKAISLLKSYITLIEDYIPQKVEFPKMDSNKENVDLTIENNKLKDKVFELERSVAQAKNVENKFTAEASKRQARILELESNMLQLEDFSLKQLFKIIHNLKWGSLTIILGIIGLIFCAGLYIGHILDLILASSTHNK